MATKRIYLDLDDDVIAKASAKAHDMRLPRKRYIEALIERDCADAEKGGAKKTTGNKKK